jgi:hypothetical protein
MGDTAPRSLCLGGELLIPLRGAAFRSSTVDQQQAPLGANTLYLNSLLHGLAYYLRLPSPPPSTGGPPCTGPPLWPTRILPLTFRRSETRLRMGKHSRVTKNKGVGGDIDNRRTKWPKCFQGLGKLGVLGTATSDCVSFAGLAGRLHTGFHFGLLFAEEFL